MYFGVTVFTYQSAIPFSGFNSSTFSTFMNLDRPYYNHKEKKFFYGMFLFLVFCFTYGFGYRFLFFLSFLFSSFWEPESVRGNVLGDLCCLGYRFTFFLC